MSYWNRQFKKHNNKYGLYCPGKGNDLSRRVLMALTAASFFMTPFSAYASAITPANTTHSSTVVSNGNVHTVYVQEANGTVGVTSLLFLHWTGAILPTCSLINREILRLLIIW